MKKIIIISVSMAALLLQNCTKLDETVYDRYTATEFYSTPAGSNAALASVASQLNSNWGANYAGFDNCWYDVNCFSTDEQVIPHRNTGDWQLDFSILYKHTWTPSTPGIINNVWVWLYNSVFKANLAIELLNNAKADPAKIAEAKVLRAFYYYLLIDDFGDVPFYTENNITVDKIPQTSRKDVFNFIEKELKENVDLLSETKGGAYYGRFNKWAGYTLLAKLYLNAEVYTGTAKWNECLAACNKVSTGGFTLHPGAANASSPLGYRYYELFGDRCPDDETILAIFNTAAVVGNNIYAVRGLNFDDGNKRVANLGGWNGTVVIKDYVDKYNADDIRIKQFLWGPQPSGITYLQTVSSLDNPGAAPNEGTRNIKFFPAGVINNGTSNDFPVYRYADILLMRAECNVKLGNAPAAKLDVDAIRIRAGLPALLASPTLDDIYNERGFELNWEGHRRQDMIRFDKYLLAHDFKGVSESFRKLFPIPTAALNANKLLKQNPGY
ncbi:MAG: RagB/SusD family nutrient uptake outer membrane protein [Chitinophagaceae bacterium]